MSKQFLITREIGIDAGHRVPEHKSKCYNLHGHRYRIQAAVTGELAEEGEEQGMVMDFGFLKEVMMEEIDGPYDHSLILWDKDPWLETILSLPDTAIKVIHHVPTAENLARLWYESMFNEIHARTGGRAKLKFVRVWETPNCWAVYPHGT